MYDHRPIPLSSWPELISLDACGPTIVVAVPPGWYVPFIGSVLLDVLSADCRNVCQNIRSIRCVRLSFHLVLGSWMVRELIRKDNMSSATPLH